VKCWNGCHRVEKRKSKTSAKWIKISRTVHQCWPQKENNSEESEQRDTKIWNFFSDIFTYYCVLRFCSLLELRLWYQVEHTLTFPLISPTHAPIFYVLRLKFQFEYQNNVVSGADLKNDKNLTKPITTIFCIISKRLTPILFPLAFYESKSCRSFAFDCILRPIFDKPIKNRSNTKSPNFWPISHLHL
jgi:hypothetical protein